MTAEDLDARLAQEIADAELAHAAEQVVTLTIMARDGDASQEMLRTARRRLQDAP